MLRSRGARAGRFAPAVAAVTAGAVFFVLVAGRGYVAYDAGWSLVWGSEMAEGNLPDYDAVATAPTPHPLANLVGALLSPLGRDAGTVLLLVNAAALAALGWNVLRLGQHLLALPVGVLAAALVVTRPQLVEQTLYASLDIPFLALVAGATALEAARPRRGRAVLALLLAAGLLRPEAWLLSFAYLAWVLPAADRRLRPGLVALALAAPALWALSDLVVTGDPLYSRHGTSELSELLGRREEGAAGALPEYLDRVMSTTVVVCGLAGVMAGLLVLYERVLLPAAIFGLGLASFLALEVLGLPLIIRYVLLPGVMLALFAAVAGMGWVALRDRPRLRAAWAAAGAAVIVALAVSTAGERDRMDGVVAYSHFARDSDDDLYDALTSSPGRAASRRCPAIFATTYLQRPLIAYWLDRAPEAVESRPPRSGERGLAVVPSRAADPPGFERVGASGRWAVAARC